MNPITHLLTGWTIADLSATDARDRAIISWAAVAPDVDGLTLIPDLLNRWIGKAPTEYYFQYHHFLTHGLPAALVYVCAAGAFAKNRFRTALLSFLAFHVHLACDLVGSRGPDPGDIWPIHYLEPLSSRLTFAWSGQWPLNAWQNIFFTLALMTFCFVRAVQHGHSPVILFSSHADSVFVSTLRNRFRKQA